MGTGPAVGTVPLAVPVPAALAQRPDLLLCRVAGAVQRLAAEALAPLGLNTGTHSILAVLSGEEPRSQQALAESLRIDRSTMVALVDDLERSGHVLRRRNPGDRRAYLVEITVAGRGLLRRADEVVATLQETVFGPLPGPDRAEIARLLRDLVDVGHLPGFDRSPAAGDPA
jgi:DNA-binding MarR family transcriptional regulator